MGFPGFCWLDVCFESIGNMLVLCIGDSQGVFVFKDWPYWVCLLRQFMRRVCLKKKNKESNFFHFSSLLSLKCIYILTLGGGRYFRF